MATSAESLIQKSLIGEALDSAPVLVFVADEAMKYVAVNQWACEVLGYSRDELLQLRVSDVAAYSGADEEYSEMVAERSRSGTSDLRRRDGSTVKFRYVASETKVASITFYVAVGVVEP
jgi:PAS domain S-box-containing protein